MNKLTEIKIRTKTIEEDPVTGAITSEVIYLPDFEQVYFLIEEARDGLWETLNESSIEPEIRSKIDNDKVLKEIHKDLSLLFNRYRTHIRTKYPKEYREIQKAKSN